MIVSAMNDVLQRLFTSDPSEALTTILTLAIAFVVALPVGWDRERENRTAGLRTFPLVSAASAAFILVGRESLGPRGDMHAYIVQGVMTGLGFLGAGVIIRSGDDRVRGTATAISLWSTAAMGAAIAYGRLEIALVLVAIDLIGLRLMRPVKKVIKAEIREAPRESPEPVSP